MGQLIDEMETLLEEKRYGDYYKQQIRFHEVFIEAGGNRELAALISHQKKIFVMQNYHPTSDAGMFHESLKNGNRGHMEILRLFREKRTAELKAYLEQTHCNFRHANLETLD